MSDFDKLINQKVCKFYPGDPNNCIKALPLLKIKIAISIVLIIFGIMLFKKSNDWITELFTNLFTKFSKFIGVILIVVGGLILNNSIDAIKW